MVALGDADDRERPIKPSTGNGRRHGPPGGTERGRPVAAGGFRSGHVNCRPHCTGEDFERFSATVFVVASIGNAVSLSQLRSEYPVNSVNMPFTRRQVLAAGATTGFAAIAGCSADCGFFGRRMSNAGEIAVDSMEFVPADATIVEFSQLPKPERELLRKAIKSGGVQMCMDSEGEQTNALYSFGERTRDNDSYLSYKDRYYGLYVGITDQLYVATAGEFDYPDGNPCC